MEFLQDSKSLFQQGLSGNFSYNPGKVSNDQGHLNQQGIDTDQSLDTPDLVSAQADFGVSKSYTRRNGIMDEAAIRKSVGYEKAFGSSTLLKVMQKLNAFHTAADQSLTLSNVKEVTQNMATNFTELTEAVRHYVHRGASWHSNLHIHKKEEKALLPIMSSLLIQLYSLGNVFEHIHNVAYDYLLENGIDETRFGEILSSDTALAVKGNMSSVNAQTGQNDKTLSQMKKFTSQASIGESALEEELMERELPDISGNNKHTLSELRRLLQMIDKTELSANSDLEREDIKIHFIDLSKMISIILSHPELLSPSADITMIKTDWRGEDLSQAREFFQRTSGKSVKEALKTINQLRIDKAETAAADSIKTGGALSQVLIDVKKNRVLRTAKSSKGVSEQKDTNNFNYDEAMSRLAELTGLGGQAGARTTYYKDTEGKLQYGTNMAKAAGVSSIGAKLSFGAEEVDSHMRDGRHNIFGYASKEELERNVGIINSSFNMQIIDYLAFHKDRHLNNIYLDLNAKDPQQAFTGIDNDNVFGKGTKSKKDDRLLSYENHAEGSYQLRQVYYRLEDKAGVKGGVRDDYVDVASTLKGFQIIPKEIHEKIKGLDEDRILEGLKPYLDRAARFALLKRIKKLKDYVNSQATVVDINTPEGMMEFRKGTTNLMLSSIFEGIEDYNTIMNADTLSLQIRSAPSILTRILMVQYFSRGTLQENKDPNKSGKYVYNMEQEFVKDEKDLESHFNNISGRNETYWRTLDSMMQIAGKTREQVWDEGFQKNYGDKYEILKEDKNYLAARDLFIKGKLRMFSNFNQSRIK